MALSQGAELKAKALELAIAYAEKSAAKEKDEDVIEIAKKFEAYLREGN